jgi:hypothetical protein
MTTWGNLLWESDIKRFSFSGNETTSEYYSHFSSDDIEPDLGPLYLKGLKPLKLKFAGKMNGNTIV